MDRKDFPVRVQRRRQRALERLQVKLATNALNGKSRSGEAYTKYLKQEVVYLEAKLKEMVY